MIGADFAILTKLANSGVRSRVLVRSNNATRAFACRQACARHPTGGPLNNDATLTATTNQAPLTLERAIQCARIGDDNKAKDIAILDLRGITPIFDFFILMNGASRRQIHTLAEEVDDYMRTEGEKRLSIQGYQASRW